MGWGGHSHTQRPGHLCKVTQNKPECTAGSAATRGSGRTYRTRHGPLVSLVDCGLCQGPKQDAALGGDQPCRRGVYKSRGQLMLERW